MAKTNVAIIGSGNIGVDLMVKILRTSKLLEMRAMVGIDPHSDGLARARAEGIATTDQGIDGLIRMPLWSEIDLVFDATSAGAHEKHSELCRRDGKRIIDLTPRAIGPFCVPAVNIEERFNEPNINMVSCGGQATIPIVYAVKRVSKKLPYAEIVASMSSKSAGPGTRANIDEVTRTTAKGIEMIAQAEKAKAIVILNPAEPPLLMRNTVYTFSSGASENDIEASVEEMIGNVRQYVPGYRLKHKIQFERFGANRPLKITGVGEFEGLKSTMFLEVEGAGHYLPTYAGNLDIMTSAGLQTAERLAERGNGARP